MSERITLDAQPSEVFADVPARQIRGVAIPLDSTAEKGGRVWRFKRDSVTFGERTPLLAFHDVTKPVGKLTGSEWTDRGLECSFTVSKTEAGNEILQLASDGVLGLSVGIDVTAGKQVGDVLHVSAATAHEVSVTPCPAFAGASIDHVALSKERTATVPDDDTTTQPAAVQLDAEALGKAIGEALMAQATTGPVPVPVPTAVTSVREELPYRFDGQGGAHGFVADAVASSRGDGEATGRLEKFLSEVFVTQANVTALNPTQNRPDLYLAQPRYNRPLAGLISTGTLPDATPFVVPKFNTAAGLVAPHVEGVEPSLGSFTATSQTITPGALSGKAELTREVFDAGGSPAVDQLVWQEMLAASAEAAEERVAALLDGLTLTPIDIVGTDTAVVDGLVTELIAQQFQRGGLRFSSLALHEELYAALVNARDADGRRLLPVVNGVNADGSTDANFGTVRVGTATGVPTWGLDTYSYLMVPTSVYQWVSAPKKLVFDVQVKSVYIGFWQYAAEAVIRDSDVKRISWAAA